QVNVLGDAGRLEQVFSNLLDNAVKYSPDGGPIRVELSVEGTEAVCAVADAGMGMNESTRAQLFERFHRAEAARTRHIRGLGLGLFICREIVTRHGGRIWVETTEGKGSTFYVAVPLQSSM